MEHFVSFIPFGYIPFIVPYLVIASIVGPCLAIAFDHYFIKAFITNPCFTNPYLVNAFIVSPQVFIPFIVDPLVTVPFTINPLVAVPSIVSPLVIIPFIVHPLVIASSSYLDSFDFVMASFSYFASKCFSTIACLS